MNAPVPQIIWVLLGFAVGAVLSWLFARARQREALSAAAAVALQASTELQIELSTARERASRVLNFAPYYADARPGRMNGLPR